MRQYNIKIHGPYTICGDDHDILEGCPYSDSVGVYFWAVKMPSGQYRVSYLGEISTSFYKRTKEHIIQTLGGNYQICDSDLMLNGEHRVIWNGLWRKGTRDKLPEFIKNYEEMAPKIKSYLSIQKLFVAPLEVDRRTRQRIEAALAKAIHRNKEAANLLPHDIRYYHKKDIEEELSVIIEPEHQLEGLPEVVNA